MLLWVVKSYLDNEIIDVEYTRATTPREALYICIGDAADDAELIAISTWRCGDTVYTVEEA